MLTDVSSYQYTTFGGDSICLISVICPLSMIYHLTFALLNLKISSFKYIVDHDQLAHWSQLIKISHVACGYIIKTGNMHGHVIYEE